MNKSLIMRCACLLSADKPAKEAVQEAVMIHDACKKTYRGTAFSFSDYVLDAASIPGELSPTQRAQRAMEIENCAKKLTGKIGLPFIIDPFTDQRKLFQFLSSEDYEKTGHADMDFKHVDTIENYLKMLLPKKRTHAERLVVFREFANCCHGEDKAGKTIERIRNRKTSPSRLDEIAFEFFHWHTEQTKNTRKTRAAKGAEKRWKKTIDQTKTTKSARKHPKRAK